MEDKKRQSGQSEKELVKSVAIGAAVGGITTYALMKNKPCDDCDCNQEKLNHKKEYISHKKLGLCDDAKSRCDSCPQGYECK